MVSTEETEEIERNSKEEEEEKAAEEAEGEEVEEEAEEVEEAEEKEEEKPSPERAKEVEEEIVEERVYTIPLSRAWISPRKKRSPRAIRILRSFVERHMKPDVIVIANEVNEKIWGRGIEKPPRKIRIRAVKDSEGKVTIHLAEED